MSSLKPIGQKAYGSIPHLPGSRLGPGDYHISEGQTNIATLKPRDKHDVIIVQEKLDGSNVAIAKFNNEILALTRSGYLASSSKYRQHHFFAAWVDEYRQKFVELLNEGERLCGEWLAMAHGTRYILPHDPFVAFDLITGTKRRTYLDFEERVQLFNIPIPHRIHYGSSFPIDKAMEAIKISGHGAIDEVEGAIWRVERKGEVDFLCKFVNHFKQDGKYFAEQTGSTEVWNYDVNKWIK